MIAHKKKFYGGAGLMAMFIIVLIIFFSPVFNGQNGLEYLDDLYNSISKGSAHYIADLKKEALTFSGTSVNLDLAMKDSKQAQLAVTLFTKSGASANVSGSALKVAGDLAKILGNCLTDADHMYGNEGRKVADKYGYEEKRVLYNWWTAMKEMDKNLKKQKMFKEAKIVTTVKKKAVESSYNYYKIVPQKISDKYGTVIFSLIFYVVYTVWYGFAIMFMFEGWGMKLEH
ncbi:MAG: hypothetical protein JSU83_03010 [Deltaproteobacteria bacterium]|nr:MAG: hypothetical protein JSU83_03010 [Deltaproteobacteria bacterium]